MALTPAEKQKLYRDRKKDKAKRAGDLTHEYLKIPFNEWMTERRWADVTEYLEWLGVTEIPDYLSFGNTDPDIWPSELDRGSIGRAEKMVTFFLDGARELALNINKYKTDEIDARIAEIEAADLTNPAVRKKALKDITKLTRLREGLAKTARVPITQWQVKGETVFNDE